MRFTKGFWLITMLLSLMLLSSCTKEAPLEGVPITPEMLESVSLALTESSTATNASTQADQTVPVAETAVPDIVYWTESGTVYHTTDQCGTLKNSTAIMHGSVEEAMLAKKERPCKTCS